MLQNWLKLTICNSFRMSYSIASHEWCKYFSSMGDNNNNDNQSICYGIHSGDHDIKRFDNCFLIELWANFNYISSPSSQFNWIFDYLLKAICQLTNPNEKNSAFFFYQWIHYSEAIRNHLNEKKIDTNNKTNPVLRTDYLM